MLNATCKRSFGLFGGLKKLAQMPLKYGNYVATEGKEDYNPLGNLTEKFDDEAAEWKSVVVEGAFELNSFQNSDMNIQPNFGTVDNPHLIFTSDIPYRYVGCTGAPGEDDYEGHEMMYFLLREGPLQRCMSCGQVFKLVRLRDEQSAQNDYYQKDFVPQDILDMGESDHWIQLHVLRFMMMHSYEHTHFEVPSDSMVSLKNHDDHDRLLVDPAYRLEQLAIAEAKADVQDQVLVGIERAMDKQHGREGMEFTKANYENLIQADMAIARLRQHFRAVQRFNIRGLLDPANHERREKRMRSRALERTQTYHALYLNDHTESELQYRDYYESDSEALSELNLNMANEREQALSNPDYELKNFVFLEQYSNNRTPDSSSYIDKKVFRFNYRQALYSEEDHQRKDQRMKARLTAAGFEDKLAALTKQNAEQSAGQPGIPSDKLGFYDFLVNQAVENYKNYFESDLEEDFEYVEQLPLSEKKAFASTFDANNLVAAPKREAGVMLFERKGESDQGLIQNIAETLQSSFDFVASARNLTGVNRNQQILEEALQQSGQQREGLKESSQISSV